MHEHVSKRVRMHRKPTSGTNKHVSISLHEAAKENDMHKAIGIIVMHPKWLHPNKALWASGVITQPQTH